MIRKLAIPGFALCLRTPALAAEVSGVTLADKVSVGGQALLRGLLYARRSLCGGVEVSSDAARYIVNSSIMDTHACRHTAYLEDTARSATPLTRWGLADIDFDGIHRPAIADDSMAFKIVVLASFIETGSDLYADNLIEHFAGDAEVSRWLGQSWKPEELQHGSALREYAARAWPEFDWKLKYEAFFSAYSRTCTVSDLEPARPSSWRPGAWSRPEPRLFIGAA